MLRYVIRKDDYGAFCEIGTPIITKYIFVDDDAAEVEKILRREYDKDNKYLQIQVVSVQLVDDAIKTA